MYYEISKVMRTYMLSLSERSILLFAYLRLNQLITLSATIKTKRQKGNGGWLFSRYSCRVETNCFKVKDF